MSCFYQFGKFTILIVGLFFVIGSLIFAFVIDFHLIASGEKPYFFDPEKIDAYETPMLADFEKKLQDNYDENQFDFQNLEDYIPHLPQKDKFSIEFIEGTEVSISGSYDSGWKSNSSIDYADNENTQYLSDLGWTRNSIEDLKIRLEKVNCISFEKKDGFRAGFIDENSRNVFIIVFQLTIPRQSKMKFWTAV